MVEPAIKELVKHIANPVNRKMNLRTIIVDDEPNAVEILSILLETYGQNVKVVGTADSVASAIKLIDQVRPDLVFLDIEMPDGSGFEVLKNTRDFDYHLIFTTAYNQYAVNAFKVNAVDYLLKPIDIPDLLMALSKVTQSFSQQSKLNKIGEWFGMNEPQKNLSIATQSGYELIPFERISHISADSNYCKIHLIDKQEILVSKTLKKIEEQLDEHFIRVHNSHVVHIKYVEKFLKMDGGYLVMQSQTQIPISKNKKAEVMKLFVRE